MNGGVGQYRAFFTDAKYQIKEEDIRKVSLLRDAFNDLAMILYRCLTLHGRLIGPTMKVSHNALVELFNKNFKEEIIALRLGEEAPKPAPSSRVSIFQDKRYAGSQLNERASISNMSGSNYSGSRLARSPTNASTNSSSSSMNRSGRSSGYPSSNIQPGYSGLVGSSIRTGASTTAKTTISSKSNAVNGGW